MNDLYTTEWGLLLNFFMPSTKLIEKRRVNSKIIKRHDAPTTPLARVLASPHVHPQTKQKLSQLKKQLNPFDLQRCVSAKIKRILRLATVPSPGYKSS